MPNSPTPSRLDRWRPLVIGSLAGLPLLLAGLLFCLFLWKAYLRAKETRTWIPTPCLVEKSEVGWKKSSPNSPIRYHIDILYRYRIDGASQTSNRVRRVDGSSADKARIEKRVREFPIGRTLDCYVDPKDPGLAILEHATLAPLYTMWFPSVFVICGIGILIGGLRRSLASPPPDAN